MPFTNRLRKFGLNIWAPIPIQEYKIKSGYGSEYFLMIFNFDE